MSACEWPVCEGLCDEPPACEQLGVVDVPATRAVDAAARVRSVTIEPDAQAWPAVLPPTLDPRIRRFREQLGLPTDRAVVATGHQAEWWHPGVLAKYIAADAWAATHNATTAWIVIDQDPGDPYTLRRLESDEHAGLIERIIDWRADREPVAALSTGLLPAMQPRDDLDGFPGVADAMRAAAGAPSAAAQIVEAQRTLMARFAPGVLNAVRIDATSLARTDLFAELLDRMMQDPSACVHAFNNAAARHPDAGVRALRLEDPHDPFADEVGPELPLWRLRPGMSRSRVTAGDLTVIPRDQLVPRGLLATGMLRTAGCELFIHGLGGGHYAPVEAEWLQAWVSELITDNLAPATVVSATVLPTDDDIAAALTPHPNPIWLAHHARHDPAALGDSDAADRKRELLAQIDQTRAHGDDPAPHFRSLHELLDAVRTKHAEQLAELDRAAREHRRHATARRRAAELAVDRTLPFVAHEPAVLDALAEAVRTRLRSVQA